MEEQRLETFIKKQKLKYFGHFKRSNDLEKIILEGIIDGERERGRPTEKVMGKERTGCF